MQVTIQIPRINHINFSESIQRLGLMIPDGTLVVSLNPREVNDFGSVIHKKLKYVDSYVQLHGLQNFVLVLLGRYYLHPQWRHLDGFIHSYKAIRGLTTIEIPDWR